MLRLGSPALGGLAETLVLTELLKLRGLTSDAFDIYHLRDRDGREITRRPDTRASSRGPLGYSLV